MAENDLLCACRQHTHPYTRTPPLVEPVRIRGRRVGKRWPIRKFFAVNGLRIGSGSFANSRGGRAGYLHQFPAAPRSLVPKLCLGTHWPETPFPGPSERDAFSRGTGNGVSGNETATSAARLRLNLVPSTVSGGRPQHKSRSCCVCQIAVKHWKFAQTGGTNARTAVTRNLLQQPTSHRVFGAGRIDTVEGAILCKCCANRSHPPPKNG
jgi:hypothetical protein